MTTLCRDHPQQGALHQSTDMTHTWLAKNGKEVKVLATNAHTTWELSPLRALRHASKKRAAAHAMDSVALPAPAFASTTSAAAR